MLPNVGNLYGDMKKCAGDFYNLERVLTYGRPWNFITGPRSCGKTTATAIFLLLDFIKNGRKFLYLRRTKDELDLTKGRFFSDACNIINDKLGYNISVECKSNDYTIYYGDDDGGVCGHAFYLSKEEKLKSGGIFIYNVVYDEFICQDSTGYLGTLVAPMEYTKTLELFATLDRAVGTAYRNEVRFIFLGNTATIYNPIFTELDMTKYIQSTSKIIAPKGEGWVLHQLGLNDIKALDGFQDSNLFKLSTDAQKDYNFNNVGRDDEKTFVEKKPSGAHPVYVMAIENKRYGVYVLDGLFYISTSFSSRTDGIALDVQSHDGVIDKEYIKTYGGNEKVKLLTQAYERGQLRFDNARIKHIFLKYFRYLPN